jgi:hypothetical protein
VVDPRAESHVRLKEAVRRNRAFSREGLLERLFERLFRGLVYTQIWEDPEIDLEALALGPDCHVVAIASGIADGLGFGHNTIAALITRGLAEIMRLATALGGRPETLAGLAGLGDLVLTCTGSLSRNRYVGIELARGRPLEEIVGSMKMVAEGVKTTGAALDLGARVGVELPIAAQMADVLAGRRDARAALEELMLRPQRAEADGG